MLPDKERTSYADSNISRELFRDMDTGSFLSDAVMNIEEEKHEEHENEEPVDNRQE